MNSDLISRTELKKCAIPCQIHNGALTDLCVPLYQIDNAPTVDLWEMRQEATENALKKAEVLYKRPQGEWIEIPVKRDLLYNTGIKYTCSICGKGNCYGKPPFCMYCGADMRGKEE